MQKTEWKKDYEEFEKVTRQFYAGDFPAGSEAMPRGAEKWGC